MSVEVVRDPREHLINLWLGLAKDIVNNEASSIADLNNGPGSVFQWQPEDPTIFDKPISLSVEGSRDHRNNLILQEATFGVNGAFIKVSAKPPKTPKSLLDNPFSDYVWENFISVYTVHPHHLCMQAVSSRQAKLSYRQSIKDRAARRKI